MKTLISGAVRPKSGDLVLARVEKLGYQTRLELPWGRMASLHPGDLIVVAYGDRYATDQFEAEVPTDLGPANLVATGGVASNVISRTAGIKPATNITPIGLVGDASGRPLNLAQFAIPRVTTTRKRPRTIAVLGTSMNSGKTTTNRHLVMGLSRAGYRPGAAKVTGTGSGGDYWSMVDAGAHRVVDFTDAGFSSTYKIPVEDIEDCLVNLVDHLSEEACGIILVEIADGVFQDQNISLIRSEVFKQYVDGIMFAAGEALGAARGLQEIAEVGMPVLGLSGRFTASQLLIREAGRAGCTPIYTKDELSNPEFALRIVGIDPRPVPGHDAFMCAPG